MSAPTVIKLTAENLADEARGLAPGDGRRRPVEVDATGLRQWLVNYAALPALETEDCEARLHLSLPARRLVVQRVSGRLGTDENGTFVAATVEEIESQILTAAPISASAGTAAEAAAEAAPVPRARARTQALLLAVLLAGLAATCWWNLQPETIDGVEWITSASERQAVLDAAAGNHASDEEKLHLDAVTARLTATTPEGEKTLGTTVRVGRQAGGTVLVTEAGVLLQVTANGQLRVNAITYRRVPTGG